jgi:hypothetical protein
LNRLKSLFLLTAFLSSFSVFAQTTTYSIKGTVTDAQTNEPIPFASVSLPELGQGVISKDDGTYSIRIDKPVKLVKAGSVGYKSTTKSIESTGTTILVNISLEPVDAQLKEVIVKPKKYSNKDNPAVELIQLVIDNRDKNRVQNLKTFKTEQYEKVMVGLSNISEKTKARRVLRSWKPMLDNVDTTKMQGLGITPIYLQENIQDHYSRNDPKQSKTIVKATQKVVFPLMDDDGLDQYIRYLYQDVDLYENFVVVLTDHFLSPIAPTAPLFYRYYPVDTLIDSGSKIVHLEFYPRNKTDLLLQGHLYIALDSTYPVTAATFTLNGKVSINWVRSINFEQRFDKLPNSDKWILNEEYYQLEFSLTSRGSGAYAERLVSHKNPELNVPIPDSLFQNRFEQRVVLKDSEVKDSVFWNQARHFALSKVEAMTYQNMDSLQKTSMFKKVTNFINVAVIGFYMPTPEVEIGRINAIYAFNPIEGTRLRIGARTRPDFSKRINFEGYGAYGFKDQRWKYGIGMNVSMRKDRSYNSFPLSLFRINYQEDLRVPGLEAPVFVPTSIATSFVRGSNDKMFFLKRFSTQWEHEFRNRFSFTIGLDHRSWGAEGSLTYVPTDTVLVAGAPVIAAKPFIDLRFAPGEQYYTTKNGWRQRIRYKYIANVRYSRGVSGIAGSQYNFDELYASLNKFTNTPPFGYNYIFIEGGAVYGKVPYPLLKMHQANQTYGFRFYAYNLMNFMEFASDRYIAFSTEQSFYGFFTNKIPLIKRFNLREFITFKILYGQVTKQNTPTEGSGLYRLPEYPDGTALTYTLQDKPYMEGSVGIGNIFKVLRVDLVRRYSYLDHPNVAKYGVRVAARLTF